MPAPPTSARPAIEGHFPPNGLAIYYRVHGDLTTAESLDESAPDAN